jgi:hypothetical protein
MTINRYPSIGKDRHIHCDEPEDWTWKRNALCHGVHPPDRPDIFYPEPPKGVTGHKAAMAIRAQVRVAQQICADCPVRAQCFQYGVRYSDAFGIYGGHHFGDNRRRD